ncbi:hypothetical protein CAOG_009750 [Capsaspora owczarzaki ATCC 30864]|uniref:Uncharacterized protein n=1 Tax=Capsaspora owczarzaki (strain ATCC 30864) TaxID=595528 RepID=A0A0D2UE65_CAPO3|nr:hypothetical protein CAOG_009750 [Capsaspora owczarzaki ATCC 30864]
MSGSPANAGSGDEVRDGKVPTLVVSSSDEPAATSAATTPVRKPALQMSKLRHTEGTNGAVGDASPASGHTANAAEHANASPSTPPATSAFRALPLASPSPLSLTSSASSSGLLPLANTLSHLLDAEMTSPEEDEEGNLSLDAWGL